MKTFKKLMILVCLTLFSFMFVTVSAAGPATEASTLVVHYFRFDGEYANWSLWLWQSEPDNGEGARFSFTADDEFGKVRSLPLAGTILEGATSVGFIVSTASWDKDVAVDRFIDMSHFNESGEVHVYLIQGEPTIYYDRAEADTSNRVLFAHFTDTDTIQFKTTMPVAAADVTLYVDDVETEKIGYVMTDNVGTFSLAAAADLFSAYVLSVDFGDPEPATAVVGFDGIYDTPAFEDAYGYDGTLGAIYSLASTTFKLWAPISLSVTLNLYTAGHRASETDYDGQAGVNDPSQTVAMAKGVKGLWFVTVDGDLDGVYYTYSVENATGTFEIVDPYAVAAGVNGDRGMVIDFDRYDPEAWAEDERPDTMESYTDAIIYELHVRDLTTSDTWNGPDGYRGKFLGLVETGTTYGGLATGFDHMIDLGVTHVQLLPVFDSGVVDETRLDDPTYAGIVDGIFNWGYMPENFNVVEGSYSTDPYNGAVRVTEFKEMIQTFHGNDIRVIMDVVYNHTGKSADSNFNLILPGYYYRMNADGSFSNGSGTGNETASERIMVQKFMLESILFWVTEYHIDGFRFDLMKLHDVETMSLIADAVHAIDDTIMIYGEPWTGGTSPLPVAEAAFNATLDEMAGVAVFNDDTRDGIKGSVFSETGMGFVQGYRFYDARILLGIAGGTLQEGIVAAQLPKGAWALQPTQTINYVECHDNNTLYDKIMLSSLAAGDPAAVIRMQRQAYAMIFLSQGITFMQAGSEFLRTKPCATGSGTCDVDNQYDHNSYRSPDSVNQIDWSLKVENIETYEYFKTLIHLRKMKDVFTLSTIDEIAAALTITEEQTGGLVSYTLTDTTDVWNTIFVVHNGGDAANAILLPEGEWNVVLTTDEVGEMTLTEYQGVGVETLSILTVLAGNTVLNLNPNDTYVMVRFADDYIPEVEAVAAALATLSFTSSLTEDTTLTLPASVGTVTLAYASSDAAIIDPVTGEVHASALTAITSVTLTVTASRYGVTQSMDFVIAVGAAAPTGLGTLAIIGIVAGSFSLTAAGVLLFLFRKRIFKI